MREYAVWTRSDGGWATEPRSQEEAETERQSLIDEAGPNEDDMVDASEDLQVREYDNEEED